MTNQAITVWLSEMNNLADVICKIDDEQSTHCKCPAISELSNKAHEIIIGMMGKHAANHYALEE